MGRRALFGTPMTTAQRQRRHRANIQESIHAEADLAGDLIAAVRRGLPKSMTGNLAAEQLLEAIDALDRLRDLVRRPADAEGDRSTNT